LKKHCTLTRYNLKDLWEQIEFTEIFLRVITYSELSVRSVTVPFLANVDIWDCVEWIRAPTINV